jgi:hypothetical protein
LDWADYDRHIVEDSNNKFKLNMKLFSRNVHKMQNTKYGCVKKRNSPFLLINCEKLSKKNNYEFLSEKKNGHEFLCQVFLFAHKLEFAIKYPDYLNSQ